MGSPQRPITSLHPNPPMIGRSRFSTEIKLAQGRGRGEGYLQRKGGKMYNIYIYINLCMHYTYLYMYENNTNSNTSTILIILLILILILYNTNTMDNLLPVH